MRNARRHEESIYEKYLKIHFCIYPLVKKNTESMNEHRTYACDFIRFFLFTEKSNSYAILRRETQKLLPKCART